MNNRPNWRNEKEYKFTKKTPLAIWAWQFLRRSPRYAVAWQAAKINSKSTYYHYPDIVNYKGGTKKYGFYFNVIINPDH